MNVMNQVQILNGAVNVSFRVIDAPSQIIYAKIKMDHYLFPK